jgi:sugar phosphate isomerase/epimerase
MASRRRFMQSICGGVGVLAMHRAFAENQDHLKLRFGFSLYGTKSIPLHEALKLCADTGYDCVELPAMADWPGAPERFKVDDRKLFRDTLAARNIHLSAIMENLTLLADERKHQDNLKRLEAACDLGRSLSPNPNEQPLIETVMGGSPGLWEQVKDQMVARLQEWSKVAEQAQTQLAIKAHVSGAAHLPEHVRWLIDRVNSKWVKAAFDFSHFQLRQVDLRMAWDILRRDTIFIHIKDSLGDKTKFQFVLPGEGSIDYGDYFKMLKETDCHADILVEISGQVHSRPDYDPRVAVQKCYNAIAPAFAENGLR